MFVSLLDGAVFLDFVLTDAAIRSLNQLQHQTVVSIHSHNTRLRSTFLSLRCFKNPSHSVAVAMLASRIALALTTDTVMLVSSHFNRLKATYFTNMVVWISSSKALSHSMLCSSRLLMIWQHMHEFMLNQIKNRDKLHNR